MPWNYRIMRLDRSIPDEPVYRIHEVYYDDAGAIQAYAEGAAGLVGSDLYELRRVHARIADAFSLSRGDVRTSGGAGSLGARAEDGTTVDVRRGHDAANRAPTRQLRRTVPDRAMAGIVAVPHARKATPTDARRPFA